MRWRKTENWLRWTALPSSWDTRTGQSERLLHSSVPAESYPYYLRVKAISVVTVLGQQLATTASSDGTIKVYSLAGLSTLISSGVVGLEEFKPIASFDTKGSRLTCLAAVAVSGDRTTAGSALGQLRSDDDNSDSDSDSEVEGDVLAVADGEFGDHGEGQHGEGAAADGAEDSEVSDEGAEDDEEDEGVDDIEDEGEGEAEE